MKMQIITVGILCKILEKEFGIEKIKTIEVVNKGINELAITTDKKINHSRVFICRD